MGFFLAPLIGALGSAGTAAAISGATSLVGGALARKDARRATREQNAYNDPAQMRARAESAGFNPLLWAGQGNVQAAPRQSGMMGNAIANAGLAVADGISEQKQLELEKSRLEMDRERLDKLIEKQTIRPKVGGVYAQVQQTPSIKKTGAPLMNGAPSVTSDTTFNPVTEYNPIPANGPRLNTKVMRKDGMTSADPDNPVEMEGDMWTWAREGTFFENTNEILRRNTPEWMHYKGRDAFIPAAWDDLQEKREAKRKKAERYVEKKRDPKQKKKRQDFMRDAYPTVFD